MFDIHYFNNTFFNSRIFQTNIFQKFGDPSPNILYTADLIREILFVSLSLVGIDTKCLKKEVNINFYVTYIKLSYLRSKMKYVTRRPIRLAFYGYA